MSRLKSYVCVYLFVKDKNEVLLSLRQNTNFCDGMWSMIAGHVEDGESATQAMIREAKEEAGIDINANDLNAIYVMDRIDSDRQNIEIFFNCEKYSGELTNMEPNKCGGIEFFDINNLPKNTIPYIKKAIEDIVQDEKYGEFGY